MRTKGLATVFAMTLSVAPAHSEEAGLNEWWQDTFVWDVAGPPCGDNDSRVTYSGTSADAWEVSCKITKITRLNELDAVILDKTCASEGENLGHERELLLELDGGKIASFPPFQVLKRCNSASQSTTTAKPDCGFNSRLYRSPLYKDPNPNSYQELQFPTGTADGTVNLTEYREGQPAWAAHGTFTCSNGASICRVSFPLMLGEAAELPYEMTDNSGSSPEMVVIPALRQEVFQTERYAVMQGKPYGGIVADFLNGFKLKEDELTVPYNVYSYAGCKR